ncbi:DUF6046 domain-containing protein [Reichenbachiella sp.]|uniref:DUF6046 domain-containing protein n=1 Tax=Reichenbachiella sp. TaxID=2184521 RepID=UPI003B59A374
MAEYQVEITKRFLAAFPSNGLIGYAAGVNSGIYKNLPFSERQGIFQGQDAPFGKSKFGTPLWDSIKIKTLEDDPVEYTFPNDPMVDPSFQKKKTETEIFGGQSVIEAAGSKATAFKIKGILWNNDGQYPEDQLAELLEVYQPDTEIEVISSRMFLYFNIDRLFIESLSLPAIEGYSDSQPFVIYARETRPVELSIFEP